MNKKIIFKSCSMNLPNHSVSYKDFASGTEMGPISEEDYHIFTKISIVNKHKNNNSSANISSRNITTIEKFIKSKEEYLTIHEYLKNIIFIRVERVHEEPYYMIIDDIENSFKIDFSFEKTILMIEEIELKKIIKKARKCINTSLKGYGF